MSPCPFFYQAEKETLPPTDIAFVRRGGGDLEDQFPLTGTPVRCLVNEGGRKPSKKHRPKLKKPFWSLEPLKCLVAKGKPFWRQIKHRGLSSCGSAGNAARLELGCSPRLACLASRVRVLGLNKTGKPKGDTHV